MPRAPGMVRAMRGLAGRVDWKRTAKFVGEGAAKAVGALIVYGLAIYVVVRVVAARRGGSGSGSANANAPTLAEAAERAVTARTGGLLLQPHQPQGERSGGVTMHWA